jgi:hypothetical protein
MANEINALYDASSALTITLASLATSASGVGRSSTLVNNTAAGTKYQTIHIYVSVTVGTTPTINTGISVYFLTADAGSSPTFYQDSQTNAGATNYQGTDAAYTVVNAQPLGVIRVTSTTSNVAYTAKYTVRNPGPGWGIGIAHNTGVNLNSTGGNHFVRYVGENPEIQ